MDTIDELELDTEGYPDVEFEELETDTDEDLELLMRCVGAARNSGA